MAFFTVSDLFPHLHPVVVFS